MIEQLNSLLEEYKSLEIQSAHDDLSDLPKNIVNRLITRSRACIERITGRNSPYSRQSEEFIALGGYPSFVCRNIIGVVDALHADVESGFLKSHEELIHAEMFSDFIEMARYLCSEGYKDSSAVIAGSALESHLRNLSGKNEIDVTFEKDGTEIPKKADRLNSHLAKQSVYSKLDQKNVTAWLDLRNNAAHGHYDEYAQAQVTLLIDGVADFIARHPA